MKRKHFLKRDERGASAVEFALATPLLFTIIVGVSQLGVLFFANADVRNSVAAGARLASVFPRPSDSTIVAKINERRVRLEDARVTGPTISHGADAAGNQYADIEMRYSVPLNFIFFQTPAVTLVERRRVFQQPAAS
jgi:hypothetical protein